MASLHRLTPRLLPFVILAIFASSFGYCVILTPVDPIGAFYLPWTRAWELALGALVAYREVFLLSRWPYPSRAAANLGAALGVALIVGGYSGSTRPRRSRDGVQPSRPWAARW